MWLPLDAAADAPAAAGSSPSLEEVRQHLRLPPIVELHDRYYVMIDGHHRLYCLYHGSSPLPLDLHIQVVVVKNVQVDLPATPFSSMGTWMRDVMRDDDAYDSGEVNRYFHFDPACWRDLSAIYRQYPVAPLPVGIASTARPAAAERSS